MSTTPETLQKALDVFKHDCFSYAQTQDTHTERRMEASKARVIAAALASKPAPPCGCSTSEREFCRSRKASDFAAHPECAESATPAEPAQAQGLHDRVQRLETAEKWLDANCKRVRWTMDDVWFEITPAQLVLAGLAAPADQAQQAVSDEVAFEAWAQPILGDNPTWRESGSGELARQAWRAALAAQPAAPVSPPALVQRGYLLEWPAMGGRKTLWNESDTAAKAIGCPCEPVYALRDHLATTKEPK